MAPIFDSRGQDPGIQVQHEGHCRLSITHVLVSLVWFKVDDGSNHPFVLFSFCERKPSNLHSKLMFCTETLIVKLLVQILQGPYLSKINL